MINKKFDVTSLADRFSRDAFSDYIMPDYAAVLNADPSDISMDMNLITMGYPDDRAVKETIHRILSDKELAMKIFSDPDVLDRISKIYKQHVYVQEQLRYANRNMGKSPSDEQGTNGVTHDEYEAAVDVVGEFEEMGLGKLDSEQLEDYNENMEIIKKYENC